MLLLLSVLFFFSGACALVYQVMWLRLLALIFGVTVYAASTVLASFMGGLALGSFAAGRLAGQLRSPLRTFGYLEIGIGVTAFATPFVFHGVREVWIALQPSLPASTLFITIARFIVAMLVLIVPTTLMGATLPVVMRSALVADTAIGSRMGLLYAVNTGGAIAGALTAGFYFIAELGVARSFQIAALANVAIGVTAISAAHVLRPRRAESIAAPAIAPAPDANAVEDLTPGQRRAVLWTFVLSGVLSLALEIVWFRMLVILLRPTAYAFTIMLAAVLAGIALGSAVAAPLLRRRGPWLATLTVVQFAISITAVLSLNVLARFDGAMAWTVPPLTALGLDPYIAPIVIASLMAMLPTTLLLGFAFPIGLALWTRHAVDSARRVGVFYSLNVVGAIVGSVVGGFFLLPLLGSRTSLIAIAALALASSVLLAARQWRVRPNFAGFMAVVGPVAFVMCALNTVDPFALTASTAHRGERVLWRQEGLQTTVAVHEQTLSSGRVHRVMYLDGMHQASDYGTMAFAHHRIGAMPVMLHPSPADALVVGLGGGATAGAVARHPGLSVDVVELSPDVVEGAAFFGHINFNLLKRPTVHVRVDDGRNYLLTTRKRYDIITADIILPHHAGAGALYSREYFELVRNALAPGGVVLQWNGGDGITRYNLILRTFLSVFPNTTLWADGSLMVGTVEPLKVSRSAYEARRHGGHFRGLFDWTFDELMQQYIAGPPELASWVGDGPILTDDRPAIEYFLSLPRNEAQPDFGKLSRRTSDVLAP